MLDNLKLGKLKKVNAAGRGVKPRAFDILELTFAIAKIARSAKSAEIEKAVSLSGFSIVNFGNHGNYGNF